MKISFLLPGYVWGPSGGIRVVYEYANKLASRGHDVTVVHPRSLKYVPRPENQTARQWARDNLNRLTNLLFKPSIDWQPIDSRVRLLFVPNSEPRFIPDGDAIFATGWTTVQSVLQYPPAKGEKCYLVQGYESYHARKELVDASWRAPLHKVVIAKWLLELGEELGCQDLTYIPNAIDHERYRLTDAIEGRPRLVAMLFSSTEIKGSADGIQALRIAREKYPDLKAVFFGVFPPREQIPAWITYYRNPPQEFLIKDIYNKASIFISSSWSEGFALPPAEAGACGCAIVGTDSGGIREFVQHGVTGLLSPPKDPKALAENLCRLLGNEELRVQLAKACSSFVAQLSWERSTDLLEKFIKRAIDHEYPASEKAGFELVADKVMRDKPGVAPGRLVTEGPSHQQTQGRMQAAQINHKNGAKMRILVAIASWGTKNDPYLSQLIREYRSMPFDVDIVVVTNIGRGLDPEVELFVVDLKGKVPESLPNFHKKIFAERQNDYNLFIYSEDDTLVTERNIRAFLGACAILPENEVAGFFRYERGSDGQLNYPEVHGPHRWDCESVRRRGEHIFAAFTNEHSACYVLTRSQLQKAITSGGFLVEPHRGKYDQICSAATDPYTQCGFQKVIGISAFDDFLVHHLPNKYVGSRFGISDLELRSQIDSLLRIGRNGHLPAPLFAPESKLMQGRFSKDCYEPAQNEIVAMIPSGVRSVLSVGGGLGGTEVALAEKGLRVVALPVDPVIASSARGKGVEVMEEDLTTTWRMMEGEQFDCLVMLDALHLMRDPAGTLSATASLLRSGARVIVQVPRVLRLTTIFRIARGDQSLRELGNYDKTGVHFTSHRVLRRWLETAGMKIESTVTLPPPSPWKLPRSFKWLLTPILERMMGARMVVLARKN